MVKNYKRVVNINYEVAIPTMRLNPRIHHVIKIQDDGTVILDGYKFNTLEELYKYEYQTNRARTKFLSRHGFQYTTFLYDLRKELKKYEVKENEIKRCD